MEDNSKLWKTVQALNKANDWLLVLGVAMLNVLKEKEVIDGDKEMEKYLNEAAEVVAHRKNEMVGKITDDAQLKNPSRSMTDYLDS